MSSWAQPPNLGSTNQGLRVRRIRLGCTFAGDSPGPVSDALNRLAATAPYLYADRDRYWFGRQQNITRTARDDADRLLAEDRHEVTAEIVERLESEGGEHGFASVHTAPGNSRNVADDPRARLVILGPDAVHIADSEHSPALTAVRRILDNSGSAARLYRNMLVFPAAGQRDTEAFETITENAGTLKFDEGTDI